jgi:response regulator RpfG family c-di-GMP phosphodiesterase
MDSAILLVDDERHVLQSLQRLLRRDGYEIHLAESGKVALEILGSTEIAAIVCDQRMPEMTGAEVLAEAYKMCPDTVRITLTGYTDLAAAQASINEGHVAQFITKPWNDAQLRSVVADAVRAFKLVKEHHELVALTLKQKEELEQWNAKLEEQVQARTEELKAQNESLRRLQICVEQSLRDTVGILAATLEAHSPNLGIHSKRVAQMARQLACELKLGDGEIRDIEFAAHLHDIGKLARSPDTGPSLRRHSEKQHVLAAILHTEAGHALLSRVSGFEKIALAVKHQREHFDGTGSPNKLSGDQIPLAARIIAVTNAYDKAVYSTTDATTVHPEKGRRTLARGQAAHFDPELVRLLLEYIDRVGDAFESDAEVEVSPKRLVVGMTLSRPLLNINGTLLLKADTELSADTIDRIRTMSHGNPLLAGVFVRCAAHESSTDSGLGKTTNARTPSDAEASLDQDAASGVHPPESITSPPAQLGDAATEKSTPIPAPATASTPAPTPARIPARAPNVTAPAAIPVESQSPVESKKPPSYEVKAPEIKPDTRVVSSSAKTQPPAPTTTTGQPSTHPVAAVAGNEMTSATVKPEAQPKTPAAALLKIKAKVLLVDDSILVCNALKRELRTIGVTTVSTESGWNALNLIRQAHFDAALIDLMMPSMTGEELVGHLQLCAPTLPCIILTGNATIERVVTLAKEPNVVQIITKPWDAERLKVALIDVITKSAKNRAVEAI